MRSNQHSLRSGFIAAMVVILVAMTAGIASAAGPKGTVTYNSVPDDLPGNVPSQPFQAQQTSEFGDSVILANGPRKARSVDVIMSSWGCESGAWFSGDCVTSPGATFSQPITLNLYSVDALTGDPADLLLSKPQNFDIPLRPSADTVNCTGGTWYSEADDACYNGFANRITFKLDGGVRLPDAVIWTVAFNTTTYGANPIGPAACSPTPQGCPYDSLNVGVESFEGQPSRGTDTDENAAILHAAFPFNYCDGGAGGFNEVRLDDSAGPCWTGFRPLATIRTGGGGKGSGDESE
jgi:hypothetical protein